MDANYPEIYKAVRVFEGGNDDDPQDPGGRTSRGIIQTEYDKYRRGKGLPTRDVWTADESEIAEIYKAGYWTPQSLAAMVSGLDETQFDYGVNSGIGRSPKVLRRCLHMADNAPGADVKARIDGLSKDQVKVLINAVCDERLAFLQSLKTFPHFGKGWTARVAKVRAIALHLVDVPVGAPQAAAVKPPAVEPADAAGSAKAQHPEPTTIKTIVKGSGPTVAAEETARSGQGWLDWIAAHPWQTGFYIAGAVVLVMAVLYAIDLWHKRRQEAPPAGWTPPAELKPQGA